MEIILVPASVITHAISPDSYFPLWHQYYGKIVGNKNLYVITNAGQSHLFHPYELGGIWEVSGTFNNEKRAKVASTLASALLLQSRVVINVDTDEFAVPNPEKYASLGDYIETVRAPYVTAIGMNVMHLDPEGPLSFAEPILHAQRKWVLPRAPLNKTCYVTGPVSWGAGFHWCSYYPKFDDLFLFHFKYGDDELRLEHNFKMAALSAGDAAREKYFSQGRAEFQRVRKSMAAMPREAGVAALYRTEFNAKFLAPVYLHRQSGLYIGTIDVHDSVLIELPEAFAAHL